MTVVVPQKLQEKKRQLELQKQKLEAQKKQQGDDATKDEDGSS